MDKQGLQFYSIIQYIDLITLCMHLNKEGKWQQLGRAGRREGVGGCTRQHVRTGAARAGERCILVRGWTDWQQRACAMGGKGAGQCRAEVDRHAGG